MVMVAAGNSPLSTVLLSHGGVGQYQYQIMGEDRRADSGFVSAKP
jgi:hypothetical protein